MASERPRAQVAYYECIACANRWVGWIKENPSCAACRSPKPVGPVSIGRLRRKLELELLERPSATLGEEEAKRIADFTAQVFHVQQTALRSAGQVQTLAEADLRSGDDGDETLHRLELAFWIFSEIQMAEACAAIGHIIGIAYSERGLRRADVGSIQDLTDLYTGLEWFEFLKSEPFIAMSHLNLASKAAFAKPDAVQGLQQYASLMATATYHFAEAQRRYTALHEQSTADQIAVRIDLTSKQFEAAIHGWSREQAASIRAGAEIQQGKLIQAGLIEQGRLQHDGLVEHGRLISDGLRQGMSEVARSIGFSGQAVAGAVRDAGGMIASGIFGGLRSLEQGVRDGIESAGSKIGSGMGRLGLVTGLGVLGGSYIHGRLLKDGLVTLGPSIAGAVSQATEKLTNAERALPDVVKGGTGLADIGRRLRLID